jgi:hypothetical protein
MTVLLIVVSVIAAWCIVSLGLALFIGRAMKVAKQREADRVAMGGAVAVSVNEHATV